MTIPFDAVDYTLIAAAIASLIGIILLLTVPQRPKKQHNGRYTKKKPTKLEPLFVNGCYTPRPKRKAQ